MYFWVFFYKIFSKKSLKYKLSLKNWKFDQFSKNSKMRPSTLVVCFENYVIQIKHKKLSTSMWEREYFITILFISDQYKTSKGTQWLYGLADLSSLSSVELPQSFIHHSNRHENTNIPTDRFCEILLYCWENLFFSKLVAECDIIALVFWDFHCKKLIFIQNKPDIRNQH